MSGSSSRRRATISSRTTIAATVGVSWSSSKKSHRNGRIKDVLEFHQCKTKFHWEPEHYIGTLWPNTGIAKWKKLYDWFKGVSGCWINSQWKFSRYQSTNVIPTSSDSWRNAKPFFWSAEPQRRAAKHLGHTWKIGKRFCKSRCVIIRTLSSRIESMEFIDRRVAPCIHSGEKWKARTRSRSEMPISQKFSHPQWKRLFKDLKTNNDCRFRIFISTNSIHQPRSLAGR